MNLRRLVLATHRDLGYFFTGVILIYALSGVAVNHVNDWNPNFIVERRDVAMDLPADPEEVTREAVLDVLRPLSEEHSYKSFDFPSSKRIKIYLEDGSVTGILGSGQGEYETIRRRPILFEANSLHLNPGGWWLWFSDLFAISLAVIAVTGLFVARGPAGLGGRGKWIVLAGVIAPLLALLAV